MTVKGSSRLTDVDIINDRYLVTTCDGTKLVYILDGNGKQLSSLNLNGTPCGIAALQNTNFLVAMRNPGLVGFFIKYTKII